MEPEIIYQYSRNDRPRSRKASQFVSIANSCLIDITFAGFILKFLDHLYRRYFIRFMRNDDSSCFQESITTYTGDRLSKPLVLSAESSRSVPVTFSNINFVLIVVASNDL